ncbi:ubiquitin-like protein UBact [Candidatus Acetothermia bacterium]|jgi:hypothetical protein|nr:ubiquitin-like protein UBact [Candidatus Acetothermia bacterium]MCI2432412.1 ubiquitin-like protein UBact [Candidatus Acetothermia bacterium]MCI2436234.1 ubiquitin-like protein UBact [Candidatus Acetothermia bacterium]
MPERVVKPTEPWTKRDEGDGPRTPNVPKPDTERLLEKMRRVDPRQAQRYRQRSGE